MFTPTQKPVVLFEYLIKHTQTEGDIVLDNVAGSGTTAVAAKIQIGIIFKKSPYIEIINKRLKQ